MRMIATVALLLGCLACSPAPDEIEAQQSAQTSRRKPVDERPAEVRAAIAAVKEAKHKAGRHVIAGPPRHLSRAEAAALLPGAVR